MYIENVTELAFDDVTPEDPDFPSIQGMNWYGFGYYIFAFDTWYLFLVLILSIFIVVPHIIGLAEAGLISSKLSKQGSVNICDDCNLFSPEW